MRRLTQLERDVLAAAHPMNASAEILQSGRVSMGDYNDRDGERHYLYAWQLRQEHRPANRVKWRVQELLAVEGYGSAVRATAMGKTIFCGPSWPVMQKQMRARKLPAAGNSAATPNQETA